MGGCLPIRPALLFRLTAAIGNEELAATSSFAQAILRGVGRNRLSVAISVAFMAVAVATLYHLLRGIDVGKVVAAIEAQSGTRILIAAVLVVAGYSNLIFYDLFALHTIGKRNLPFPVVAFASFTSYTIGHSLGAATLTCGLGAVPGLFVLGFDRRRHRQDRVHDRRDVLARQYIRSRRRRCLRA